MHANVEQNGLYGEKSAEDRRVRIAVSWIGEQLSSKGINLDEIANALNISNSHFRHLFSKHTGMSPSRYHKLLRLRKAQHLLLETFLNVKQVMAEVGWSDESHFCRDYKRMFGHSPSQTRLRSTKTSLTKLTVA